MPRFAANLSLLFTEHPLLERPLVAARAGFRAVELHFPYAHDAGALSDTIKAAGVELVLFNLPPGDWAAGERGLAAVPGCETQFMDGLERALTYAEALGVNKLHVMAGILADESGRERARATYLNNLQRAAECAAKANCTLLIEAINRRDMPGYFLDSTREAVAICAELKVANLGILFDMYHAQILGGDLCSMLDRAWPWLGHVQIAGVPGRHEPDAGEIDYRWLLAELDRRGYAGWVGCEYHPRGATEAGLGWRQAYTEQSAGG